MRHVTNGNSMFNDGDSRLKYQSGFSLIEYVIAITLGILILSLVFELYKSMEVHHQFINQVYDIYTDAQTLVALINNEIHAAGRMGCEK